MFPAAAALLLDSLSVVGLFCHIIISFALLHAARKRGMHGWHGAAYAAASQLMAYRIHTCSG